MLIYEVNIHLKNDISNEFSPWLKEHIEEMLEFPGFKDAKVFHLSEEGEFKNPLTYTIHYFLDGRDSLSWYFKNKASMMRQKGLDKFAGQLAVDRRILLPREL